ncbi:MAG: helix-turn-helix domain-containing protein, partial [Candidatus Dormibacteraceae bacterium]
TVLSPRASPLIRTSRPWKCQAPRCYAWPIMIHIAARPRSMALAPFVASFHYHQGQLPGAVEQILPTGQAHLMVNLDEDEFRTYGAPNSGTVHRVCGAVLAGPHGGPIAIDTREQRWLIAVEFKVGGVAAFFPMPMSEACNKVIELDNLWGHDGSLLRERLCEASTPTDKFRILEMVLLERIVRPRDPAVDAALSLLDHGASVAQAREAVGLLPKTFVRRFQEQVGLAPKRISRVLRLQRIVASVHRAADADWSIVAAEHGYTDQAHFIHDFRDLTGMTPTAYRPSAPHRRNHVPFAAPIT